MRSTAGRYLRGLHGDSELLDAMQSKIGYSRPLPDASEGDLERTPLRLLKDRQRYRTRHVTPYQYAVGRVDLGSRPTGQISKEEDLHLCTYPYTLPLFLYSYHITHM